jgi:pyrroloquinoline quinone (PQQ) biosynthesis protein C
MKDELLSRLDATLSHAVARVRESPFVVELLGGRRTRDAYQAYLREAYHYVRLTSSFTPLAARRMDPEQIKTRQWILRHSAAELGHELMALADLEDLGHARAAVEGSRPGVGTLAWVHFFHYQVTMSPPFSAMGVLYFLEGMAAALAPLVAVEVAKVLGPNERRAVRFFREHGELDSEHIEEQRDVLVRYCLRPEDQEAVRATIEQAGHVKRFMLDKLLESLTPAPAGS